MDPNANIERQREIAREIAERDSTLEVREDGNKTWSLADLADELAELVLALAEWRQEDMAAYLTERGWMTVAPDAHLWSDDSDLTGADDRCLLCGVTSQEGGEPCLR